jgi:hypothetical protein
LLLGNAKNKAAIWAEIARVPVLRIGATMDSCHDAENHTANVLMCQIGSGLSLLLNFWHILLAEKKVGFDAPMHCQPNKIMVF